MGNVTVQTLNVNVVIRELKDISDDLRHAQGIANGLVAEGLIGYTPIALKIGEAIADAQAEIARLESDTANGITRARFRNRR